MKIHTASDICVGVQILVTVRKKNAIEKNKINTKFDRFNYLFRFIHLTSIKFEKLTV